MTSWIKQHADPLILAVYSLDKLNLIAEEGKIPEGLYKLPCHSQKVERIIKALSESSMRAANPKKRERIIQNILASREELPKFENKSQFRMKWNFGAVISHKQS